VSINPDAHSATDISDVYFGVGVGRKGMLSKDDVLNCLPADKLLKFLKSHRKA